MRLTKSHDQSQYSFSLSQETDLTSENTAKREGVEKENEGTQRLTSNVIRVSEPNDHLGPNLSENIPASPNAYQALAGDRGLNPPRPIAVLSEEQKTLIDGSIEVEGHVEELERKLKTIYVRRPKTLCDRANDRTNVFEDVSAATDACQVIVTTNGDAISATRVTTGTRSVQVLGQMSDATLQLLSTVQRNSNKAQQKADTT